jgi:hypothetical protein
LVFSAFTPIREEKRREEKRREEKRRGHYTLREKTEHFPGLNVPTQCLIVSVGKADLRGSKMLEGGHFFGHEQWKESE